MGQRLRWFCFRHPVRCVKELLSGGGRGDGYSPAKALTVALAGTLGVGNITGVAAAIALGGAGALFWMWISAALTMLIKYAEVSLAVRERQTQVVRDRRGNVRGYEYRGGPMCYVKALRHGNAVAVVFCVLCIGASFVQGNLLQMAAAVSCTEMLFSLPLSPTVLLLTLCAAIFIFGGRERIAAFTARMIPLMCGIYIALCTLVLWENAAVLPGIFCRIIKEAFSPNAVGGGVGGCMMRSAIRHGCAKGVFSHEAGCGTSPISHAGANTDSAHRQGLFGIAEVFVDTIVLCTLTGLVLLVSGFGFGSGHGDYARAVTDAFSAWFGDIGGAVIGISIVFYAFSTLVCWSFYGTECVRALCCGRGAGCVLLWQRVYRVLYLLTAACGAFVSGTLLWNLSDVCTMGMTVLNTTALMLLYRREEARTTAHVRHTAGHRSARSPS